MNETQFYDLWTKFANSDLLECLPDDVEEFCAENEITVSYFIEEFLWLNKIIRILIVLIEQLLNFPTGYKGNNLTRESEFKCIMVQLIIIKEGVDHYFPVSGTIKQDIINSIDTL